MLNAVITARGGSKGLPRKNIKILHGHPLIHYCYSSASIANCFENIYLSTDDPEIAQIGESLGMTVPFLRPKDLAQDNSRSIDVVKHLINTLRLDGSLCLLQPTSPLIACEDILNIVALHKKTKKNIFTASESPIKLGSLFSYRENQPYLLSDDCGAPRQTADIVYQVNGAAYLCSVNYLQSSNQFIDQQNSIPYFMPEHRSLDIDSMLDFKIVESILADGQCLRHGS